MKVLKFRSGIAEWSIPLDELSDGLKRMLRMQWREFINELRDAEENILEYRVTDIATVLMLERMFDSSTPREGKSA